MRRMPINNEVLKVRNIDLSSAVDSYDFKEPDGLYTLTNYVDKDINFVNSDLLIVNVFQTAEATICSLSSYRKDGIEPYINLSQEWDLHIYVKGRIVYISNKDNI